MTEHELVIYDLGFEAGREFQAERLLVELENYYKLVVKPSTTMKTCAKESFRLVLDKFKSTLNECKDDFASADERFKEERRKERETVDIALKTSEGFPNYVI